MTSYRINGRDISFSTHIFNGTLSVSEYEDQIYSALSKIGISRNYITINTLENFGVKVSWVINEADFSFSCISQESFCLNIGAVAQAIQEDVRQILRGIKDLNLVMKQYATSDIKIKKVKNINHFFDNYEDVSNVPTKEKIDITSSIQAKRIVSEIKLKYPKFKDYSLIPESDRDLLREAYIYLGVEVKF